MRPCTTGPRSRAGTKVKSATIKITEISTTTNVGVSVRSGTRQAGYLRLPARELSSVWAYCSGYMRPVSMARPPTTLAKVIPYAPTLVPLGWR